MRFTITGFDREMNRHVAKDETGKTTYLDLFTDATFPELRTDFLNDEDWLEYMRSLKGKVIECEYISPYIPCYFVSNSKFINP